MEKIETTLCVSSGKGLNTGNFVLMEAFGASGGVEAGGIHGIIDSKLLHGDQEATAAAVSTTVSHPSKLVTSCWKMLEHGPIRLLKCVSCYPAAGKWPPPHLHLSKQHVFVEGILLAQPT